MESYSIYIYCVNRRMWLVVVVCFCLRKPTTTNIITNEKENPELFENCEWLFGSVILEFKSFR